MNKGSWGKVRAFFDLTTSEGFVIKGFKIIEGINGLFVSMPSQKSNDGEYYDSVFATKELRDELNQIAPRPRKSGLITKKIECELGIIPKSVETCLNEIRKQFIK